MLWEATADPGSVRSLPFIDGPAVEHIWGAQKHRSSLWVKLAIHCEVCGFGSSHVLSSEALHSHETD